MEQIKTKFVSYDEQTKTLTVAFAADTTRSNNPDDYPSVAIQIFKVWPGQTMEYIVKEIARMGKSQLERIIAEEQAGPVDELEQELKGMIGTTITTAATTVAPPSGIVHFRCRLCLHTALCTRSSHYCLPCSRSAAGSGAAECYSGAT